MLCFICYVLTVLEGEVDVHVAQTDRVIANANHSDLFCKTYYRNNWHEKLAASF